MSDIAIRRNDSASTPFSYAFSGWMYGISSSILIKNIDSEIDENISFASEATLRRIWLTPEEDEAWKDL
jgi:hypothetical protein